MAECAGAGRAAERERFGGAGRVDGWVRSYRLGYWDRVPRAVACPPYAIVVARAVGAGARVCVYIRRGAAHAG